jgi:hypothetical protein
MATTVVIGPVIGPNVTMGVSTDLVAPWKYQWKRNGVFLTNGNEKCYVTPPLKPDDYKAKYSVVVYGQDTTEESPGTMLPAVAAKPVSTVPTATTASAVPAAPKPSDEAADKAPAPVVK